MSALRRSHLFPKVQLAAGGFVHSFEGDTLVSERPESALPRFGSHRRLAIAHESDEY